MKKTLPSVCALLVCGFACSARAAESVPYHASSVAGVRVRSVPSHRPVAAGGASVYLRPGTKKPAGIGRRGSSRRNSRIHKLPGGGYVARLDASWLSASHATVVNGKPVVVCVEPGHSKQKHYHDARGGAHRLR